MRLNTFLKDFFCQKNLIVTGGYFNFCLNAILLLMGPIAWATYEIGFQIITNTFIIDPTEQSVNDICHHLRFFLRKLHLM